jgi:NTE family protein
MRAYLEGILGPDVTFKDLNLPLSLNAVDLRTDREVILRNGSVVDAAMATSAYPGVFPPVRIDGRVLVDGGVLNNVPVSLARKMGVDVILAVDVSKSTETLLIDDTDDRRSAVLGFAQTFFHAAELMQRSRLQANLDKTPPDLLLRPSVAAHIGIFTGFTYAEEIIAAGEAEARRALPRLLALMGRAAPSRSRTGMQASPSRDQIPTHLKMA